MLQVIISKQSQLLELIRKAKQYADAAARHPSSRISSSTATAAAATATAANGVGAEANVAAAVAGAEASSEAPGGGDGSGRLKRSASTAWRSPTLHTQSSLDGEQGQQLLEQMVDEVLLRGMQERGEGGQEEQGGEEGIMRGDLVRGEAGRGVCRQEEGSGLEQEQPQLPGVGGRMSLQQQPQPEQQQQAVQTSAVAGMHGSLLDGVEEGGVDGNKAHWSSSSAPSENHHKSSSSSNGTNSSSLDDDSISFRYVLCYDGFRLVCWRTPVEVLAVNAAAGSSGRPARRARVGGCVGTVGDGVPHSEVLEPHARSNTTSCDTVSVSRSNRCGTMTSGNVTTTTTGSSSSSSTVTTSSRSWGSGESNSSSTDASSYLDIRDIQIEFEPPRKGTVKTKPGAAAADDPHVKKCCTDAKGGTAAAAAASGLDVPAGGAVSTGMPNDSNVLELVDMVLDRAEQKGFTLEEHELDLVLQRLRKQLRM